MTIQVIRIQSPQFTAKAALFLKLQTSTSFLKWSFLSTSPIRRLEMRNRGAKNVVNPFKQRGVGNATAVWIDEWQSFTSSAFEELIFEIFCDQGVGLVVLSQSFKLKNESKAFLGWLHNTSSYIYFAKPCPKFLLSSSKKLILGLKGFAKNAESVRRPFQIPSNLTKELLIPLCIEKNSHLLSLSRHYEVLAYKGPCRFYLADILLWWLGGHSEGSLLGSECENKDRRYINKEGALPRQASHRRISFEEWKAGFCSFLRRPGWRQENEAYDS